MVNLSLLLYFCAKNHKNIQYGNIQVEFNKKLNIEGDEDEIFSDDVEELYFQTSKWARIAISKD